MIRVYCTTVPGTSRYATQKLMLERMDTPYEFVFGELVNDAPLDACKSMQHLRNWVNFGQPLECTARSWGCKQVMLAAMEKVYNDGDEWSLVIQDDVKLIDNWQYTAKRLIEAAPDYAGSISVLGGWICNSKIPINELFYKSPGYAGLSEPAQLIRRWYAKANADAMKECPAESDWCYHIHSGDNALIRSRQPLAYPRRAVPSTIEITPIGL